MARHGLALPDCAWGHLHLDTPSPPWQVDSSGFSVTYTPVLRQYNMGVLKVGSYDITVPPGQAKVELAPNVCPGSCTAARIPSNSSVTLYSTHFVMRTLGRTIKTRHIRNNTALQPVGYRNYYDPQFEVGRSRSGSGSGGSGWLATVRRQQPAEGGACRGLSGGAATAAAAVPW